MAELVPTSGTVSYNGVTFGAKTETVAVDIRPVPVGAGRTVAYNVYSITLKGLVNAGTDPNTDLDMDQIRKLLTAYGGELRYSSRGLGTFSINTAGGAGVQDVVWGPKPQLLRWKPTGSNQSSEITWTVEVA